MGAMTIEKRVGAYVRSPGANPGEGTNKHFKVFKHRLAMGNLELRCMLEDMVLLPKNEHGGS
jgi:hypothetical protein